MFSAASASYSRISKAASNRVAEPGARLNAASTGLGKNGTGISAKRPTMSAILKASIAVCRVSALWAIARLVRCRRPRVRRGLAAAGRARGG
jgi:hypothetical protein